MKKGKEKLPKSQIRTDESNPNPKRQGAVNSFLTMLTDRQIGFLNPTTVIGVHQTSFKDTNHGRNYER